jgi:hypothetical protein
MYSCKLFLTTKTALLSTKQQTFLLPSNPISYLGPTSSSSRLSSRMNRAWSPIVNYHLVSHNTQAANFPTQSHYQTMKRDKPRRLHEGS